MTALQVCLRRSLALLLCALMSPLPALCAPEPAPAPHADAGVVSALLTTATRNSSPVRLREAISWNDLLQTDRTGRMRFTLKDGSILSLGADSELRLLEHDPDAQVTDLELQHGRLRSRVVSITKADGRFEITTPVAVVHVVGTDFFLNQSTAGHLQLIVYSGHVVLNGTGALKGQSVEVSAGQFVEVGQNGISQPQPTPVSVQRDSINSTTIEGTGPNGEPAVASSHMLKTMLVVLGVAAVGAATSIAVNSGSGAHPAPTPSVAASPSAAPPPQPAASQPAVSKKK